ncbi:MAG: ABC transporter permease subunit [Spirochaetia bacterium]|jgi:NitT/TauT family transport system permease protein|nr:ABC transporter permease subunit [Spirochaetia bacterium]
MKSLIRNSAQFLTGSLIILSLWQLISMSSAGIFLPPPFDVIRRVIEIFPSLLLRHTAASFLRTAIPVLLASSLAYPAGVISGLSKKGDFIISPLSYLLYPVPKIALLPLFLLLFGLGEVSRILIVFSVIFFQVLLSVRDSVKSIEKEYFTSISIMGGKFRHVFCYVIWPHTLPRFISSVRISAATSLSVLFFAETFGTDRGLGFFIMDSWIRVAYKDMAAGIVCISLLGLAFFYLLDAAEKYFCRWLIDKTGSR